MTYRLSVATAAATLALIVVGGLVTNTGAALAVPDWPNTFGYNMFLFPWSRMVDGVLYEHSHRLVAAGVGLLTLALAAMLWRRGGALRILGVAAAVAVVLQGVLGGLRVLLVKHELAIVHGSLAQAFFGLLVATALLASRAPAPKPASDPSLRTLTAVATALVYVQIVFGAFLTHAGRLDLHLIGAALVFVVVPVVTARTRRVGDPVAAPVARALLVLLALQLLLGLGSYLARFSTIWIPGGQFTMLLLPVVHRVVGSLILGASVVLALRAAAAEVREPTRSGPLTVRPRLEGS